MNLTIIKDDDLIIIDGVGYHCDCSVFTDLTWIPDWTKKTHGKFHAFHWYGTPDEDGEYGDDYLSQPYGEVEFKKSVPHHQIDSLGPFAQAQGLWEAAKQAAVDALAAEEAERIRSAEEEESRIRDAYMDLQTQLDSELDIQNQELSEIEDNMQELLADETEEEEAFEDSVAFQLEEELEKLLADL